jgi:hypothetical protein
MESCSQSKKEKKRNISNRGMKFEVSLCEVSHGEDAILPKEKERGATWVRRDALLHVGQSLKAFTTDSCVCLSREQ